MTMRFDRLPAEAGLFMQVWAQSFLEALEQALDDIVLVNAEQSALLASVQAVQAQQAAIIADLEAQLLLIQAAQSTADAVKLRDTIAASYTTGGALLSASDAGTDATITVAGHTRYYNDLTPPVAITGAVLAGLAYSTLYYVYYDDETLSDTTPAFVATTVATEAQANAAAGRHAIGSVTTPASGGGSSSGGGYVPPGGGGTPLP